MLLVAALVVVAAAMGAAVRHHDGALELARVAYRALLLGVLPAYVVMRVGAEWIVSKEGVGDTSWVGVGYTTAAGGLLLVIIAAVLAWRATRRGEDAPGGAGSAGRGAVRRVVARLCRCDLGDDDEAGVAARPRNGAPTQRAKCAPQTTPDGDLRSRLKRAVRRGPGTLAAECALETPAALVAAEVSRRPPARMA